MDARSSRWREQHCRLLRACGTSVITGPTQFGVFALLTHEHCPPLTANVVALFVAAQVSFALSCAFVWPDRGRGAFLLLRRWLGFHGSTVGTSLLNLAVFVALRPVLPDLLAVPLASGIGALTCYALNDVLVFRAPAALRRT
jgi:putative flippase GtrA